MLRVPNVKIKRGRGEMEELELGRMKAILDNLEKAVERANNAEDRFRSELTEIKCSLASIETRITTLECMFKQNGNCGGGGKRDTKDINEKIIKIAVGALLTVISYLLGRYA
jgi:hypothetical protein